MTGSQNTAAVSKRPLAGPDAHSTTHRVVGNKSEAEERSDHRDDKEKQ
jgi:hypothetical protein